MRPSPASRAAQAPRDSGKELYDVDRRRGVAALGNYWVVGTLRLSDQEAGFRKIRSAYKYRAKRDGLEWAIPDLELRILLSSRCIYCGQGPTRAYNKYGATSSTGYPDLFEANGIDRVENDKPYVLSNVVTACWTCNSSKGSKDRWTWFVWIKQVHDNLQSQGLL